MNDINSIRSRVESLLSRGSALQERFQHNQNYSQLTETVNDLQRWQFDSLAMLKSILPPDRWRVVDKVRSLPPEARPTNFTLYLPEILSDISTHLDLLTVAAGSLGGLQKRDALVMKGGGVKGIALAGAIHLLECCYQFDAYVGTSAGAIAAALLAAGYTGAELEEHLYGKNFRDFLDAWWFLYPWNLATRRGIHQGHKIEQWIADLIYNKLGRRDAVLAELPKRAVLFATTEKENPLVFDSQGSHSDTPIHFAVRCSMSIPWFFQPKEIHGRHVFDGGLGHNFPVKSFLELEQSRNRPVPSFIGLYLGSEGASSELPKSTIQQIINILLKRDEETVVENNLEHILTIDTTPVGFIDFALETVEKDFLIYTGRAAAARFLCHQEAPGGPDFEEMERIVVKKEHLRHDVHRLRGLPFF